MAPASKRLSPVSLSEVTAAVRPTPEDPRPVVAMARGAVLSTNLRSWDLAVEGSPTIRILMSLLSVSICLCYMSNQALPSQMCAIVQVLFHTTEQQQKDGLLDVIVSIDTGRQ